MKKSNLFLVLMMALIVMSCSKDETTMSIPQESNAIEFGTYVGRSAQTRASDITTDVLKGKVNTDDDTWIPGTGFGVFAYYTSERAGGLGSTTDGKYVIDTSKPNFMYNQKVEWKADTVGSATGAWEYKPVKYWPNQVNGNADHNKDYVSFFAYAPYSAASTTDALNNFTFTPANDAPGDPKITYIVNTDVKKQEDLLWGVESTSGLPFLNQQKQTTTGNIKFQFKHALARIGFNVEAMVDLVNDTITGHPDVTPGTANGTIDDSTKIVVTKVELIGNFYPSGTLNLNNTAPNEPLWDGVAGTEDRTFELTPTDNFETVADHGEEPKTHGQAVTIGKLPLNNDDSYLMVIPQKFESGSEVKIRVTYDVITSDDKLDTKQSKVTNVITSDEFPFNFVGGNAYTFNLHLGMTSVKFDADVTEWAEGGETVVNVPINN